jgi:membrane-associated phospholipid phosphatase
MRVIGNNLLITSLMLFFRRDPALSVQNILTCIISIVENRHYLSQVIDGVALGTIYGLAARKTRPKWEEFLRQEEREVNKSNFVHHKLSFDAIE